jgi:hypothetical protein
LKQDLYDHIDTAIIDHPDATKLDIIEALMDVVKYVVELVFEYNHYKRP